MYKLNKKICELTPYSPITGDYSIRLDANESCFNLPDDMIQQIKEAVAMVDYNRYPDPYASDLCKAFADYYSISPENVTAFNGSDELITVLMSSFFMSSDTVVTVEPDFSMYRFYTSIAELNCVVATKCNLGQSYSSRGVRNVYLGLLSAFSNSGDVAFKVAQLVVGQCIAADGLGAKQ